MTHDYVIAGGGSAGSTLAERLSEDAGVTVCLIEAGGEGKSILVRAPLGVGALVPGRPKISNWAFETVPQPGLDGRRGYQPRGKVLGGSSSINGMIYVRGHPGFDIGELGRVVWDDVLPYFRGPKAINAAPTPYSGDGPLKSRPEDPAAAGRPSRRVRRKPIRRVDDFNGLEQEGAGLFR